MFGASRYHVAAGSFLVARADQRILQAFLGTCVGVSLYDGTTRVGGVFHILLPEPVSIGGAPFPEKYASTGFPLFLKAFYEAGGVRSHTKAVIAGGALVGPIEDRDLALDIGGRSVDIVRRLLAQEGISVERSETGGFFTCRLNLNLASGESSIEPAGFDRYTETRAQGLPTSDEISRAITDLAPIPQVALKILRLVNQGEYDFSDIAEEVRKDQVISAKTLQLSNSALFSIRRKIETLDHALLLIGRDQLIKLVISAAMKRFFEGSHGYSLCKGGLYHHALGTALTAEKIAQVSGRVSPGIAYTAGLLHDIGKVVLDQYVANAYPLFYRDISEKHRSFLSAEKAILGTDHTEVGLALARKWDFPDSISDAIRFHHAPEQSEAFGDLTHVLFVADLLMERFGAGLELEQSVCVHLPERLGRIGLSLSQLPTLVDALPPDVFSPSGEAEGGL